MARRPAISSISDPTSYAATLTAVSAGNHRHSEIASALGRPSSALAHLLSGLQDIGLLEQVDDALRGQTQFRISEPTVRLHQLLIQCHEPELVIGRADRVWSDNAETVAAKIYGPHFEELARQWCLEHADADTLGGHAGSVLPTEIACRQHRQGHELDLVISESRAFGSNQTTAIGEAKATSKPVDIHHLERLEHLRDLLPATQVATQTELLLFSRTGSTPASRTEADNRPDIELIDLHHLYNGN